MTRFITVKRRSLLYLGLVVCIVFFGVIGINMLGSSEASTNPTPVEPELKILSIEFEPQIVIRDVTYGGEVFKGLQTIKKSNFKVSAVIQNMTEKTMTNVPIRLSITSLESKTKAVSKEGKIPTLEPGATARVTFENINALGDAKGKSATIGQHEMLLAIKSNIEGGITQNTEARLLFNVDSTLK